ncbi:hypothetical protein AB0C00_31345, partial [Micromonospora carbonacea]
EARRREGERHGAGKVLNGTDLVEDFRETRACVLRAAVRAAALARGLLQPATPDEDDLLDPIGGGPADFRRCAQEIERSLAPVAALIEAAG